jgi:hypothetical protein
MKRFVLAVVLLAATAAHAQTQKVFRCVDERGGIYYTEKPGRNCKQTRIDTGPGQARPPKAPAARDADKARMVKRSAPAPLTKEAHCSALSNEAASLSGGKSALDAGFAAHRLSGIQKELARSCQ